MTHQDKDAGKKTKQKNKTRTLETVKQFLLTVFEF